MAYHDALLEILDEIAYLSTDSSSKQIIEAIIKVSSLFSTSLDLDSLIRHLTAMTSMLLDADRSTVYVRRIEKVDPQFQGAAHDLERFLLRCHAANMHRS